MEVHIDLGNVSQIINENDIRSRIRNIRRFLTMTEARLNRLHVIMVVVVFNQGWLSTIWVFLKDIQSGAPLDDSNSSTIILGSVHTTTSISDGGQVIGIETSQNLRNPFDFVQFMRPSNQAATSTVDTPSTTQEPNPETSPSTTTTEERFLISGIVWHS